MKNTEVKKAVAEAKRFIKLAGELKINQYANLMYIDAGKESGALRRASMDLTRQLAKMRKP